MPSWQSYLADPFLRLTVKRKLAAAADIASLRAAFRLRPPAQRGATYTPETLGGIPGEWTRGTAPPAGTILYLHGGGYIVGSPQSHRAITAAYATRGLDVYAPDYRLAPENPFPAAVDDALAAYEALLATGIAPTRLAIAGDSAGGGLALATLLAARDKHLPMPACALLFSPWTDLACTGDTIAANAKSEAMLVSHRMPEGAATYLAGADPRNPLASPLYGNLTGLPALFIEVGQGEILRADSTRLATAAQAAGIRTDIKIWPNLPHVWQISQAFLPEARQSLNRAAAFAKASFGAT